VTAPRLRRIALVMLAVMLAALKSCLRLPDQGVERVSGGPLRAGQHVRVHGHGDHSGCVAEALRHDLDRRAAGQLVESNVPAMLNTSAGAGTGGGYSPWLVITSAGEAGGIAVPVCSGLVCPVDGCSRG
jgi:hypothetical protein